MFIIFIRIIMPQYIVKMMYIKFVEIEKVYLFANNNLKIYYSQFKENYNNNLFYNNVNKCINNLFKICFIIIFELMPL